MCKFSLEKIFLSSKTAVLPALIFGIAVWSFLAQNPMNDLTAQMLNNIFYLLTFASMIFLRLTDRLKPFFVELWILGAYIFINRLKTHFGADLKDLLSYELLFMLFPINVLCLEQLGDGKLFTKRNFILLCVLLLEAIVIEKTQIIRDFTYSVPMFYISIVLWIFTIFFLLSKSAVEGTISSVYNAYALISVFLGFCNQQYGSALALYFMTGILIMFLGMMGEYAYAWFKDPLTGVFSRRSYYNQSQKSFPLKYSLGVVCIDNYEKLSKAFGIKSIDKLTRMVVNVITKLRPDALIYRYEPDEFILIFKNEDKKQCFESMENIRRAIAGSTFMIKRDTSLKITISAGVSEKKRSDADAEVVLGRTREAVQRAYKFTQNMTSKA